MQKQPAEKSYVFDKGYRDVGHAFSTTWGQMFDSDSISRMFENKLLFIPNLIVFLVITVFRLVINTVISVALILLFLLVAPPVYIGFVIVAFFDWVFRLFKRISSVCPNCQYRFDLPAFMCPTCGRKHTRLIPSQYGIFKRKCLCGEKLPTTFFNGRHKLKASCRECGCHLPREPHVSILIPVVGGPSAGKTCFINMAISQIESRVAPRTGCNFVYLDNGFNDYRDITREMNHGHLPEKTNEMRLMYYQFFLTPRTEKIKRLISICDVGGEIYADSSMIGNQVGFRYANGFVIVIDPLSVSQYRKEMTGTINPARYGASTMTIDEILSLLITTLENQYSLSARAMLKTDVAIVFTKADLPGLSDRIGRPAVDAYLRSHKVSREEASTVLCEDFLRHYQEDNFVNTVRAKFKTVRYFTCSSLGGQQAKPNPEGVEEPIMWLINQNINNSNKKR